MWCRLMIYVENFTYNNVENELHWNHTEIGKTLYIYNANIKKLIVPYVYAARRSLACSHIVAFQQRRCRFA